MAARKHPAKQRSDGTFKRSKIGKYNAKGRRIDDIWFASKAEGDRYEQLKEMVKQGIIRELELQKKFPVRINNVLICNYLCDFYYMDRQGNPIIEDVKGMQTDVYKLKKKMMKAMGLEVIELPASAVPRSRFLTATEATRGS